MVKDPRIDAAFKDWWHGQDTPEQRGFTEGCRAMLTALDAVTPRPAGDGARPTPPGDSQSFQIRVHDWMIECFGAQIAADIDERNHRFLEEALELTQANGCTASEAHQLVDYVFARPIGDIGQEVGGVTVTLAALCNAVKRDFKADGETELRRVWTMVDKIRAKQAAKPKHSPLPGISADPFAGGRETPPHPPFATPFPTQAAGDNPAADDARATPPGEALVPWQPPPDRPEPNTAAGLYLMRSHVDWLLRKCGFTGEKTGG